MEEAPTPEARADILKRITEIDEQNAVLLAQLAEEGASDDVIAQEIERLTVARILIDQFDEVFQIASVGERKAILRECLRDIVVDRTREVVVYHVRPLPGWSLEDEMEQEEATGGLKNTLPTTGKKVVGSGQNSSSGDPLQSLPTKNVENLLVFAEMTF